MSAHGCPLCMTDGLSECICEAAAAVATSRTRADEARRIVGRLREEIADLGASNVHVAWSREPLIAAGAGGPVLRYTIEVVVDAPDEAAP